VSEGDIFSAFATHESWIGEAMKEARLAADKGEVPVGAIIVRDGQVIGRGHNQVESLRDPTAHAEILAIGSASGHGENWRLEDTTLYVTLEPCTMCCGAILLARVGTVVFGAADQRAGAVVSAGRLLDGNPYRQQVEVVGGISAGDCGAILSDFFKSRRD
jgi:tRNA(adenine34) deaminase